MRTKYALPAIVAAAALLLTGCVDNSTEGPGGGGDIPTVGVDEAAVALLPEDVKASGKLVIGIDPTYAPNEYKDDAGNPIGWSVDLGNAMAAKLGLTAEYQISSFDKIIPSITGGTYDIGLSSFTDNEEREAKVDFVNYYEAGIQWAQPIGKSVDPANACGLTVAVQATTYEETDELPAKSQECTDAGKEPITILKFEKQDEASNALALGRADAMTADSPITQYAVSQLADKIELAGDSFDTAPYGIAIDKGSPLALAIQAALQSMVDDGSYKTILDTWGVYSGAIPARYSPSCSPTWSGSAPGPPAPPHGGERPAPIKAIRLRHPWRIAIAVVLVVLLALFVIDAAQREAYGWDNFAKFLFDKRISQAAGFTLLLTIYSMAIAIVLGITLSVMRLSDNPVVKGVAWLYLWIFRGTPVYVQLAFWGLFATIYSTIDIGIPFTAPWISFETKNTIDVFWLAVIGLSLNEAAYMAEIVRAGILSVDKGQDEAATALGMSWLQTMRRIVIPQAMRIIIPPTGNEVISMLKTTSLVAAVPFSFDLYGRARDISVQVFDPIPLLLVASAWYLLFTSILMVGQYFLEKRFSRGVGQARPDKKGAADTGTIPVTAQTMIVGAQDQEHTE